MTFFSSLYSTSHPCLLHKLRGGARHALSSCGTVTKRERTGITTLECIVACMLISAALASISWLVVQFRSQNHALRRSEVAAQMLVNCSEVVKSLPIDQVTEELIEKNTRPLLDELSWKDAKLKAVVTSIEQPIPCKRVHLNIFWRAPSGIEQSLRGLTFWSFASDTSGSQQP